MGTGPQMDSCPLGELAHFAHRASIVRVEESFQCCLGRCLCSSQLVHTSFANELFGLGILLVCLPFVAVDGCMQGFPPSGESVPFDWCATACPLCYDAAAQVHTDLDDVGFVVLRRVVVALTSLYHTHLGVGALGSAWWVILVENDSVNGCSCVDDCLWHIVLVVRLLRDAVGSRCYALQSTAAFVAVASVASTVVVGYQFRLAYTAWLL